MPSLYFNRESDDNQMECNDRSGYVCDYWCWTCTQMRNLALHDSVHNGRTHNCWLRGFGRLPSLNEFATDHEHKRPACLMFNHYRKTYLDLVGDRFSVYHIVAERDRCDISASAMSTTTSKRPPSIHKREAGGGGGWGKRTYTHLHKKCFYFR